MAQPSTSYKFELNLTDLDRSVYDSCSLYQSA